MTLILLLFGFIFGILLMSKSENDFFDILWESIFLTIFISGLFFIVNIIIGTIICLI